MARINTVQKSRSGSSPLVTTGPARTAEGGSGYASDAKSEAYRLGVNLMGNDPKGSFYEKGKAKDIRFTNLMSGIAVEDPSWAAGFLPWLRREANIRTASLMGTAAVIHARLSDADSVREDELLSSLGKPGINRYLAGHVPNRADEPAELAQYYLNVYGSLPKALKRGLGDAANRLWTEYAVMKYDTESHGMRMADLANLCHIKPKFIPQQWELDKLPEDEALDFFTSGNLNKVQLFMHIINRRYGNAEDFNSLPPMIKENISLRKDVANGDLSGLLNSERLRAAGMTWEDALSLAGSRVDKGKLWDALILAGMVPIFATLRNLRNFDEAGISQQAKEYVHAQLTNPEIIIKSRILPFRFLTALENLNSYTWHSDIETATQLATQNIPVLDGETVVLVDTSHSMDSRVSAHSKMTLSGMSAFFGGAFAAKNPATVKMFIFADGTAPVPVKAGTSALKLAEEMHRRTGEVGHGTQTGLAIQKTVTKDTKRVMIFTDMQSFPSTGDPFVGWYGYSTGEHLRSLVKPETHMYGFDLAGYKTGDIPSGKGDRSHQLGGMTDHTFKWIPLVEKGINADWPWIKK